MLRPVPVQGKTKVRNRRSVNRVSTLKRATLVSRDLASKVECKLCDLSRTGARLAIAASVRLPQDFVLVLGDDRRLSCQVAWRSESQIGVRFVVATIGDLAGEPRA